VLQPLISDKLKRKLMVNFRDHFSDKTN